MGGHITSAIGHGRLMLVFLLFYDNVVGVVA